jgi:hypothetical protein
VPSEEEEEEEEGGRQEADEVELGEHSRTPTWLPPSTTRCTVAE